MAALKQPTEWPGLTKELAKKLHIKYPATKNELLKHIDILPAITRSYITYNIERHIRLSVAKSIAKDVASSLRVDGTPVQYFIVGSIRRKNNIVKDIDILVILPNKHNLDDVETDMMLASYQRGTRRLSMVVKAKRMIVKVDLFLARAEEIPYALLQHTGSAQFNIHVRAKAKYLGLILNQYGLYYRKTGARVRNWRALRTEKDVLSRLQVEYKEPHMRDK